MVKCNNAEERCVEAKCPHAIDHEFTTSEACVGTTCHTFLELAPLDHEGPTMAGYIGQISDCICSS